MHACTHSSWRDVKLLNTLSGSCEMSLLSRYLCSEWRGLCETIDQLIIVFCRNRRFQLPIWPHHVIVRYVMQCIVSCMDFQPFERHDGFEGTIMECPNMIRNKAVRGPREPVSSPDVFHYLDLECNQHTQYLLAMLCVLVYIFLKSGLIFLIFAVAHWKWMWKTPLHPLKVDFIPNLLLSCSECTDVIYTSAEKFCWDCSLKKQYFFLKRPKD